MSQVRPHGPRDHARPHQVRPKKEAGAAGPTTADATIAGTSAGVTDRPPAKVKRGAARAQSEPSDAPRPNLTASSGNPVAVGRVAATRVAQFPSQVGGLIGMLGRWDLGDLDERDRQRITRALFHERARFAPFARRFAALMTMSVLIAVMGLLADSTAVVIGAMLVAPLMTPVLGIAAALVMGWPQRVLRQVAISAVGAAGAVGLAALTAFGFPGSTDPLPGELLARTSPNLLDLGIALAAGAAGAYAQIRRAASDALTGVAVAVALVPPLAVVGITLALGEFSLPTGALLLFLANVAGIVMAAAVTFLICGLVPGGRLLAGSGAIAGGMRWAALAVIIMVLPLHFTRGHVLPATDPSVEVAVVVEKFVEESSWSAEVVGVTTKRTENGLVGEIVLTDSPLMPDAEDVASHLASELDETIAVTMQVVQVETERATVDEEEAE